MNLNKLRDKAYQCAIAHGWHEEEHSNKHWFCLIISELMEAVQADRKGRRANVAMFKEWQGNSLPLSQETQTKRFKEDYEAYIKDSMEDELSDACIRLLDLAGLKNIDIPYYFDEFIYDSSSDCNGLGLPENIFNISGILIKHSYNRDSTLSDKIINMIIAIFGLAKHLNIDILWHIENKIRYNELRSYKHNKRY